MNVLKILETVMDGPHLRTSIYFSGCTHHCKECHNPETWDFNSGTDTDISDILKDINLKIIIVSKNVDSVLKKNIQSNIKMLNL